MNKFFILGAFLPLSLLGERLETVIVEAYESDVDNYKEAKFFSTYSKDIITKYELDEEGVSNIKDALKNVSNVNVKNLGTFTKTLSIRGFSGGRVSSVVDGVKLSNHGITMGGTGEIGLVDSSSVEKIEVIKGSPSVIHDPGAIGGMVKIKTIGKMKGKKNKVKLKYNFLKDEAYKLDKHSSLVETKYQNLYFKVYASKSNSKNLNVKNKRKLQDIIDDTNYKDERVGTSFELHDLGYESDSYGGNFNYQINPNTSIFFKTSDYKGKDITSAYGNSEFSRVFRYDKYNREDWSIGINTDDYLGSDHINIFYNEQEVFRMTKNNIFSTNKVKLNSKTIKLDTEYTLGKILLNSGIEFIRDNAKTATYSKQDYTALFLSGDYVLNNWTFSAGLRYNNYKVTQNLLPGRNIDVAYDLVGVSGLLKEPLKDDSFNYSTGILYSFNEANNVAFNYSKSYRYPSLYERFAFSPFIGGGKDMKPEEANNFELSYKYLEKDLDFNIALFYSDFSTYNSIYERRNLKNQAFFESCRDDPNCDPYDDKNEGKIFDIYSIFGSFDDVNSYGFEFDINKRIPDYNTELNFSVGMTKISDAKKKFGNEVLNKKFNQEPLEFNFSATKKFDYYLKPKLKLKVRHVTNSSNVDDFKAFTTSDLYFSGRYKYVSINMGIKNITDEVYHEPYMLLDGTKRSFFINFGINFETLF